MLRRFLSGLAVVAFASVALAQEPYSFGRRFTLEENDRETEWRFNDRLVVLGRKLFFDVRLSGTGSTACASCHRPRYGFADPRAVSISDNGRRGRRNAPSLLDVGLFPTLMWDGRFRTLERQALSPFERGEMGIGVGEALRRLNSDRGYVHLFHAALGQPPTAEGMGSSLAAFQRTLVSRESRVDLFLLNNETEILTPLERHGFDIFNGRAACSNCHELFPLRPDGRQHSRPLFTDFRFHNLGIGYRSGRFADVGRYSQSLNEADLGAFRTPSLRYAARTAPYMHDGSFATLEDVVEFYSEGGRANPNLSPLIRPLFLTGYEKAALVAFLHAMADDGRAYDRRQSHR
jgi:cytochrome c peroxidase